MNQNIPDFLTDRDEALYYLSLGKDILGKGYMKRLENLLVKSRGDSGLTVSEEDGLRELYIYSHKFSGAYGGSAGTSLDDSVKGDKNFLREWDSILFYYNMELFIDKLNDLVKGHKTNKELCLDFIEYHKKYKESLGREAYLCLEKWDELEGLTPIGYEEVDTCVLRGKRDSEFIETFLQRHVFYRLDDVLKEFLEQGRVRYVDVSPNLERRRTMYFEAYGGEYIYALLKSGIDSFRHHGE